MSTSNPFIEFMRLYRDDPVKFVDEVLGFKPFDYQAELMLSLIHI